MSGKYNDAFPEGTRLGIEGLEWLRDKNLTEERLVVIKKLAELAKELDLTLPVMSLAWILKNPNVSTIILGASKETQLIENLKSIEAQEKMTNEVMEKIEEVLTFR